MITAKNFIKAIQAQSYAQSEVKLNMPAAVFTFMGADNSEMYFEVICDMSETSEIQINDLREKTRFLPVQDITANGLYHEKFSVTLY